MRVVLTCSPLPGLRAKESAAIAGDAWRERRPGDAVLAVPVSDGIAMPFVGSGADEVLAGTGATQVQLGTAGERHFAHVCGEAVLLDYTEVLGGVPGRGTRGSSRMIGEDLAWAAASGHREVNVVLPVPGSVSDMGAGLLEALARADGRTCSDEVATLAAARSALGAMRVNVLVSREQRLLGLSGVARAWMLEGLDSAQAQSFERAFAGAVATLGEAAAQLPSQRSLLPLRGSSPVDPSRNIHAGAGGGSAFVLNLLGCAIFPIGEAVVRERFASEIQDADLLVSVCARIGEDLPSSLLTGAALAQEVGIPVVVVYDSGGIRKGELANLGLNGAYELRPERSYSDAEETAADLAEIPVRLAELVGRVARTWGWA